MPVGPNVAIGRDVKIGPGTRIKDAIILKGVTIGSHSVIMNSIIDNASTIGDWARIEGMVCHHPYADPISTQITWGEVSAVV